MAFPESCKPIPPARRGFALLLVKIELRDSSSLGGALIRRLHDAGSRPASYGAWRRQGAFSGLSMTENNGSRLGRIASSALRARLRLSVASRRLNLALDRASRAHRRKTRRLSSQLSPPDLASLQTPTLRSPPLAPHLDQLGGGTGVGARRNRTKAFHCLSATNGLPSSVRRRR